METKQMQNESITLPDWMEFDREEITDSINQNGEYSQGDVTIRMWEGDEENNLYVSSIQQGKFSYTGLLNEKFVRTDCGLNCYENGDKYLGYYDSDARNKHGAYLWAPKQVNGIVHSDAYYGFWKDNQKDHHGIYIWMSQPKGNANFEEAIFDAYVGEFEIGNYKRGCYMTKDKDNYYVYYGNFDSDGCKNDEKAMFYSLQKECVIYGKIHNDKYTEAYYVFFNPEDGMISNLVFCDFKEDGEASKFLTSEKLADDIKDLVKKEANNFRTALLEVDYFGKVYNAFQDLNSYITTELKDTSVFEDTQKYPKLLKTVSAYNDVTIYRDLEKLFG